MSAAQIVPATEMAPAVQPANKLVTLPVTPMQLLQIAMNQNADIDKLTRLWELQKDWEAHEARKAYNAAFAAFKLSAPKITKNEEVDYTPRNGGPPVKYNYATLDHVCAAIIPALAAVGIGHRWVTSDQTQNSITVTCILTHVDGHSESATMNGPLDTSGNKDAIKSIASSKSYLERYTLLAVSGMAAAGHDDDGGQPEEQPQPKKDDPIRGAATLEDLQKAYFSAYRAAEAANDKPAMDAIRKAKDVRKAELSKAAQGAKNGN